MSLIPQCNDFTTMATVLNGLQTLPSQTPEKCTIVMTSAFLTRLLNWANSECAEPSKIYDVIENLTSLNYGTIVDLDSWCGIVPDCEEEVEEPTAKEETEVSDEIINALNNAEIEYNEPISDAECVDYIANLFDDTESDGKEALRKYQAKFNIVPDEPSFENPVIEDNGLTPELEDEIEKIVAIANH